MKEYRVIKEFTPIFTRVLIKREDANLLKKAGDAKIILPDKVKDAYQSAEGVIVKVGDDCTDEVKALIGAKVLFAKFGGEDMIINDEQHVLLDQGDIFGKVER
jgi:co-chaperonin GroES (HSP10)